MSTDSTPLPGAATTTASGFKVMLLPLSAPQMRCLGETSEVRERYWAVVRAVLDSTLPVGNTITAADGEQGITSPPLPPLLQPRLRFSGYSPECALRAVRSLVELNAGAELYALLRDQLMQHTHDAVSKLTQACVQPSVPATTTTTTTATNDCGSPSFDDYHALFRSDTSLHALDSLTGFWRRYEGTVKEMNMVWVYLNRWNVTRHGGTATLERLALTSLAEALRLHSRALLDRALDGFFVAVQQDLRECGRLSLYAHGRRQGGKAGDDDEQQGSSHHHHNNNDGGDAPGDPSTAARRHATLRSFADLALAVQIYAARVQPLVLTAVKAYYRSCTAELLMSNDVSAVEYFNLAAAAMQDERRRVAAYLHPHTLPALDEIAQHELLGEAGQTFLATQFSFLMQTAQLDTLALAWRLFTTSPHSITPGEFVTDLFREYIETNSYRCLSAFAAKTRATTAAAANDGDGGDSRDAPAASPAAEENNTVRSHTHQGSSRTQPFAEVRALIAIVHHAEWVIERSFAPARKEFTAALWETMESALALHPQPVSEQLASYLDATLREAHRGTLPLYDTTGEEKTEAAAQQRSKTDDDAGDNERKDEREGRGRKRSRTTSRSPSSESAEEPQSLLPLSLSDDAAHTLCNSDEPQEGDAVRPRGSTSMNDEAEGKKPRMCAERVLRDIGTLFTHLPNKAIFEALYWRQLAHRLLVGSQRSAQHNALHKSSNRDCDDDDDDEEFAEERLFIRILQDICGAAFTTKYEGMLRDLRSSREMNAQWTGEAACAATATQAATQHEEDEEDANRTTCDTQEPVNVIQAPVTQGTTCGFDPQVQLFIFAGSLWPPYTHVSLVLPSAWGALQGRIERFYTQSCNKRHLQWQHAVSTATLHARLDNTNGNTTTASSSNSNRTTAACELTGNTIQCAALLVLDEMLPRSSSSSSSSACTISVREWCSRLGIDLQVPEVMASLCGLCHESCPLLLLEHDESAAAAEEESTNAGNTIDNEPGSPSSSLLLPSVREAGPLRLQDRVRFNAAFRPAAHRLRLPLQSRLKAADTGDTSALQERVAKEQTMQLEVALVSYMKAKGSAKYDVVMSEVASRVRFAVSTAAMKRALERMTTRGILMRKGSDNYTYVP